MKSQDVPKVFVALSGGVDSSVAAALLRERGFDVVGAHMKCWIPGAENWGLEAGNCGAERDAEDARRVAEALDIPFYVFDLEKEYRERVFDYMLREYGAGRTPNPDVLCNSEIKFGVFLEKALSLGADYIATGHYARKKLEAGSWKLEIAKDLNKDQSYFLWRLTQDQLSRTIFPIGEYTKPEVRELARKYHLPTAEKRDSQGLCFVGHLDFHDYLRSVLPKKTGDVVTTSGKKVGEHDGAHFYTIGQRHGLGIGGGTPYYVAAKNLEANTLTVAEGIHDPELYVKEIHVVDVNWLSGTAPSSLQSPASDLQYDARIRYRQPLQRCHIQSLGNSVSKLRVVFDAPQRAATSGQSAVFYKGGELLGGGIIA
ncbi:MAG: tRNA 2-thiouridine(34) synthase MnmA [Candidatus Niyogibacteria bacterium]|nr:tRNA 2-thiouridine(34) synthase MnmA [Candidatus Niyogibacteria bacterium]